MSAIHLHNGINQLTLSNGVKLSFQSFGQDYQTAPIVLVNHPLTGDSRVTGEFGWWSKLIGEGKTIDTHKFAIISFNIPGNGFDGNLIDDFEPWNAGTIASFFYKGLKLLGIGHLHTVIGGSLGAGISWEMAALYPNFITNLIPVGGDWKSTDWMIANSFLQKQILSTNPRPLEIARMHAMLCYRTPQSFKIRFNRTKNESLGGFNVESWLSHHGKKLTERFQVQAYKTMNHLLGSIDITRNGKSFEELIQTIKASIHIFSIDSDLFFPLAEDQETVQRAKKVGVIINHQIISSEYGHDAFLMESEKVAPLLHPIFN